MPECFIIMPISTPENALSLYKDDRDHFDHVLEYLIMPAVEAAGLTPIPPAAQGADLIQAGIIENLERADLVLCDMSCLNPNVFFELGIRTALDKPVCMICEDVSGRVPFDTAIINYHTYEGSLAPWSLDNEIPKLTNHITNSTTKESNALWRYFGITSSAHAPESAGNADEIDNYLILQVEALRKEVSELIMQGRASMLSGFHPPNSFEDFVKQRLKEPEPLTREEVAVMNSTIVTNFDFEK